MFLAAHRAGKLRFAAYTPDSRTALMANRLRKRLAQYVVFSEA
jgi:hypothetical protein